MEFEDDSFHQNLIRLWLALQRLNKNLEAACGISYVQWFMLKKLIFIPRASAGELAETVGVRPGSLTPTIKRLLKKRFLFVEVDAEDSRRKAISITREGREALRRAESVLEQLKSNTKVDAKAIWLLSDNLESARVEVLLQT